MASDPCVTFGLLFLLRGEGLLCPGSFPEVKCKTMTNTLPSVLERWHGVSFLTHFCSIPDWASGPLHTKRMQAAASCQSLWKTAGLNLGAGAVDPNPICAPHCHRTLPQFPYLYRPLLKMNKGLHSAGDLPEEAIGVIIVPTDGEVEAGERK